MLGKCECCAVLKDEIKHLRGLLGQTLNLIAPKPEETVDPKLVPDNEVEAQQFGEG